MTAPQAVLVHNELHGQTVLAGTAYVTIRRGVLSTTFHYAATYASTAAAWEISTDLPLIDDGGTTSGLPGAMADTAPDRWGRNLIRKRHAALHHSGTRATLNDLDYLLGVSDITRQGALRYSLPDEPVFLAPGGAIPRLIDLPHLMHAARQVDHDDEDLAAIKTLLDAGSGSLGGARPKASVRDDGVLMIAKFPHAADDWDVMAWEASALDLAAACGIETPRHRLVRFGADAVLLVERFDRHGETRLGYISAMTLMQQQDGAAADYIEIAEALADHGAHVRDDLRALWRRAAFSTAINNTDDHLRNHGFLRAEGGWVLAPVFDVNPNPDANAERVTSVGGATHRADVVDALIEAAAYFDVRTDEAAKIWEHIRSVTAGWRDVASNNGVPLSEQRRFASVLDR